MKQFFISLILLFSVIHQANAQQKSWIDLNKNSRMDVYENPEADTVKRVSDLLTLRTPTVNMARTPHWGHISGIYRYNGKFCQGEGDLKFLRLIDESFAFFHPNPAVPNLTMVYKPEWDTFTEGAGWGAWWIQNSYGFSYAVTPFLEEPWFTILQRSWDIFWDNQGDGKRMGMLNGKPIVDGLPTKGFPLSTLIAPDGCLGDGALPGEIAYKQGDGNVVIHDWFYETTAAGVVMQCEILLTSRDTKAIAYYLPKMERACDFIEKTRDPKNNLFLVGPACNLLAPSYGGVKQPEGTFGKGYLAGLSITYLAALDRMVELYKLVENKEMITLYEHRQKITRQSLPLLLTPAGYFVKSLEPGGIKHGVLGQKQYGYLEGVANADAAGLRVVDDKTAESIYKQIASFREIRPFDFLLTNAPGLDDTYWSWGKKAGKEMGGIYEYGCWVNGGVWGTVEGRAILMYYRLGKFEDIYRSAIRSMKWAKDFRMDAPFTQWGENTSNLWYDKGKWLHGESVSVMVDNFAVPAATIRGLFDYEYKSDRLLLRPHIPGSITQFTQKEPVRFGDKKIYLSCRNGGPKVKSVTINGKSVKIESTDNVILKYNELPAEAKVEIITEGGWVREEFTADYPLIPALISGKSQKINLPDSLQKPYTILTRIDKLLAKESGAEYDHTFVTAAIESFEAYQYRLTMEVGQGYFRPIDQQRKEAMIRLYAKAAIGMYRGFEKRMEKFNQQGDPGQKHISSLFFEAKNSKANPKVL